MQEIQSWLMAVPSLLLVALALVAPGAAVGAAAGMRGRRLVAATPLLSVALVSVVPIVCAFLGVRWGWLPLIVVTAVLAGAVRGLRFLISPRRGRHAATPEVDDAFTVEPGAPSAVRATPLLTALIVLGPVLACLAQGVTMAIGMGQPTLPAQTYDAVFHINAVHWIHETGNGSSLDLWAVSSTARTPGFYQAAFHDLAALAHTGDAIVAVNATALVVGSVLWPLGLLILSLQLFGRSTITYILAPCIAVLFISLPEGVASWGTLYANLLANSLMPWFLAAFLRCIAPVNRHRWSSVGIAAVGGVAMLLSHPSVTLSSLVFILPPLLVHIVSVLRGRIPVSRPWKVFVTIAPLVPLVGLAVVVGNGRVSRMLEWGQHVRRRDAGSALLDLLTDRPTSFMSNGGGSFDYLASSMDGRTWILPVLFLVGIVIALRTRGLRWLPVPAVIMAVLLMSVAAEGFPRIPLTGFWYNDATRLTAAFVTTAAPLMVLGALGLVRAIALIPSRLPALRVLADPLAGTAAVLVIAMATSGFYGYRHTIDQMAGVYDSEAMEHPLVTPTELEMMRRLGRELPEGARVIGNPFNGSPLIYAVGGVDSVFLTISATIEEDIRAAGIAMPRINTDPEVCDVFSRHGIGYFYGDDDVFWQKNSDRWPMFKGMDAVSGGLPGMTVVDAGGTARVWQLTQCPAA